MKTENPNPNLTGLKRYNFSKTEVLSLALSNDQLLKTLNLLFN